MLFFGHIAIAVAAAEATGSERAAAVAGNLYPDVVDKSLRLLKLTPRGRWMAHGLPLLTATLAVSHLALPRPRWRAFVLGYFSHLAADHYDGGRLPWFAPFHAPPMGRRDSKLRWLVVTSTPAVRAPAPPGPPLLPGPMRPVAGAATPGADAAWPAI
jgi:hypothetical protein